jgi:hypothetical protein
LKLLSGKNKHLFICNKKRSMNSFENYDFENAKIYANQMNCIIHDSFDSLIMSSLECKWNTDDIESLFMKQIFKTTCTQKE